MYLIIRYPYYSSKIFLCFLLIKSLANSSYLQALTKFGRKTFVIFDKMPQKKVQAIIKKGSKTAKSPRDDVVNHKM